MIITTIFVSGILSLVHYLGFEHVLVLLVSLPINVYLGFLTLLIVVKVGLVLKRSLPYIRYLMKSINRLVEKDAVVSASVCVTPVKPVSQTNKNQGAKAPSRSFSTASRSRKSVSKKVSQSSNKFTYSKKVLDSFFKVIQKEGTLVTLNLKRKVFDSKLNKFKWIKINYPLVSALFSKLGFRLFGACFPAKGKYSSRLRQLSAFLVHIQNMNRNHGSAYVVKYLKVSQLAIQKAIAGTAVGSLNQLDPSLAFPGLATCGLPKFIPLRDRRLILLNGSAPVIRWWLTLFSVYRVIYIPGTLKLGTITDPMTAPWSSVMEVAEELVKLINPSMFDISKFFGKSELLFLESASATSRVSWAGFI
jgi:hypothetical protein